MITYAVENHVSPELIETLWNVNTPADILECASKLN